MSSINSPPSSPTLAKPTTFLARLGRAAPFIAWPILATSAWLATIMGLLIWWAGFDNGVRYTSGDQSILYVSDVAAEHQALMVAGSSLTALFYAITLFLGRWLRHIRRLPGVMRERERWAGLISVGLGWLGGVFLILLSPDRKHLQRNVWIKGAIIAVEYIGALLFIILYAIGRSIWDDSQGAPTGGADRVRSAAAVTEWVVAFIFVFYLAEFILDLWPAHKRFDRLRFDDDRAHMLREAARADGMRQVGV